MEVGFYTNTNTQQGLMDVYSAAYLRSGYTTLHSNPSRVTAFGDSVRISPEAMALFAQSYTTLNDTKKVASDGGVEGSGSSAEQGTDSSSVEHQIQTLQAQLANLQAQMKTTGDNSDLQGQIASVQAQLQTLQAQLA